jgi:hypothetical protein
MTMSYRGQTKQAIQKVCDAVSGATLTFGRFTHSYRTKPQMTAEGRWPALEGYDECWPVRSLLKLALKYGAEASRRATAVETGRRVRTALGTA